MNKGGYVYILTNLHHNVLYTGVTNDITRRVQQHREGEGGAFTKKYRCSKLVYVEEFPTIEQAIAAEKQIKKRPRKFKIQLISEQNPEWKDLLETCST